MAKGGAVHTVQVAQSESTVVGPQSKGGTAMSLRQTSAPAVVTTYKEFEGSAEQRKLLNTSLRKDDRPPMEGLSTHPGSLVFL